ncbi:oligosaccharide flippase family protein [Variovorax sp. J22G73]|uniref:lipopolysaccharide biosynthesis protein n=1 Tax=unclassified Variovorax TaxID=663243 RepID=UPI002575413A|nr:MULTISPECIES: oligosaccharide flippase family protein [unclassified Variovorax]MDM0004459.1 oligosaccharide flippase family protein [Variovorax sp. J22R203]MDM0095875.1 oligosaccharide flippase family protein [Variovorax sp. J22G73]
MHKFDRLMQIKSFIFAARSRFRSAKRHGFMRSVGVLVGGTALAQAITVLALPLLSRLYTPLDFSLIAVFSSVLAILSVAACFRLEIAIPMPELDEDAANLLVLALCACCMVATTVGLCVWWFPTQIVDLLKQPALLPYLWLLPLGIWMASSYTALQFWATRKKRFSTIAKTRMTQAIGGVGTQAGMGWAGFTPFGLLLGQVVSSGAGLFGLGRDALHDTAFRRINCGTMCRMLRRYDRFPKYSTVEALANSAGIQLPILVIAALAVGPEAGYLMLATRTMASPMGLIGGAVSQVYLSRAPEEMRAGRLGAFTSHVISGLAKTGVGPLVFVGLIAPVVFPIVFGEKWQRAGDLVAWMTPWFVMQFLASPVSMALHVTGSQRAALILQIFGLFFRIGAVVVAAWLMPARIVEVYAISGFVFYFIYLYVVMQLSRLEISEFLSELRSSAIVVCAWISFGALLALCLPALLNK